MEQVTRREWDTRWFAEYDQTWMATRNHGRSFHAAHKTMLAHFGPRPDGVPEPPLTAKIGALATGVPMPTLKSIWTWLDGKKLVAGAILDLASALALALPALLPAFGLEAAVVTQVVAKAALVVGLLHRFYKYAYKTEHP